MAACSLPVFPVPTSALFCSGVDHIETVRVVADASAVSGAQVTFYTEPSLTNKADNLLTSGTQDAIVTTGSDGSATLALAAGTYYLQIIASGFVTYTPSLVMPAEGTCGSHQFTLSRASQTELSTNLTTVALVPTSILANNTQQATLSIQAVNNVGSVMRHLPVGLTTNLAGMTITPHSTSTDIAGRASFTITASIPGTAQLVPTVNSIIVKPTLLTVIGTGGVTGTTSTVPSASKSTMTASPVIVAADGVSKTRVTVTIRDGNGTALPGKVVSPRSTLAGVRFSPELGVTDTNGMTTIDATSLEAGLTIITAVVDSVGLADRPVVQFGLTQGTPGTSPSQTAAPFGLSTPTSELRGMLIKLPSDGNPATQEDTTVYYVGADDHRHAFPNEKTYFTWYANYASVRIVTREKMADIPLGVNVTFRPGVALLKFPSSPHVYAVAKPHTLRWLTTAEVASQLFGSVWTGLVLDQSEAFAPSYVFGADITRASEYDATRETTQAGSIESVF